MIKETKTDHSCIVFRYTIKEYIKEYNLTKHEHEVSRFRDLETL